MIALDFTLRIVSLSIAVPNAAEIAIVKDLKIEAENEYERG